jgi:2,4-dienoyl-CoA reductase-like NADH-dependent reductase (Old Yellow Enzyme family)
VPTLLDPLRIGALTLRNRLYRAPVLEGAGAAADPAAVYVRHFAKNAEAGVGLIVQGHTTISEEGTTSRGMSCVRGPEDFSKLRTVPDAVHAHGAAIVVQLGHGGAFAIEGWHRALRATRSGPPWAPSAPPLWARPVLPSVRVMADADVRGFIERFVTVGSWAKDAGYDGVQIAASNTKLGHQFLSRIWNRRTDDWGGDPERRFRFLARIREGIADRCGPAFPVLLKLTVLEEGRPCGLTLDEGLDYARRAEAAGYDALTPVAAAALPDTALCRGAFPEASWADPKIAAGMAELIGSPMRTFVFRQSMAHAARVHPFTPMWNRAIWTAVRAVVTIPVFAVGGIRHRHEADTILAGGEADAIGIGRPFYAEPTLPKTLLAGDWDARCSNSNECVLPQALGMKAACYRRAVPVG